MGEFGIVELVVVPFEWVGVVVLLEILFGILLVAMGGIKMIPFELNGFVIVSEVFGLRFV